MAVEGEILSLQLIHTVRRWVNGTYFLSAKQQVNSSPRGGEKDKNQISAHGGDSRPCALR